MDSRTVDLNTTRFRRQSRQILGLFFRSLEQLDPWWFSVLAPVNEDYSTTLTALLGFEHTAGLNFLVSTGLIGSSGGDYCVVQKEWEKFIIEENL